MNHAHVRELFTPKDMAVIDLDLAAGDKAPESMVVPDPKPMNGTS